MVRRSYLRELVAAHVRIKEWCTSSYRQAFGTGFCAERVLQHGGFLAKQEVCAESTRAKAALYEAHIKPLQFKLLEAWRCGVWKLHSRVNAMTAFEEIV
jgi:hypothetical protein